MTPLPTMDNVCQLASANVVPCSKSITVPRRVLRTNSFYCFFCKFCRAAFATVSSSSFVDSILNIVRVRSFKEMARIETQWSIASMKGVRLRPSSVSDLESKARDANFPPSDINLSVASSCLTERPQQALIGIVSGNLFGDPNGKRFIDKLWIGHRCSPKTSMFGVRVSL